MPRIDEIAYRQRKRTPTERELSTPTLDERFLAQQHATAHVMRNEIVAREQ